MNKKIKSDVFTFDENVVSINNNEVKELKNIKTNDTTQNIKNNNIIKDKTKFNIDKILDEDPFFLF